MDTWDVDFNESLQNYEVGYWDMTLPVNERKFITYKDNLTQSHAKALSIRMNNLDRNIHRFYIAKEMGKDYYDTH